MSDCEHPNIVPGNIRREFLGRRFEAEGEVCADCGFELWDNSLEEKYRVWINKLGLRPKVQFKVSAEADQCFRKICEELPTSLHSPVLRAMILVYLDLIGGGEKFGNIVNDAFDSEYFQRLEEGPKDKALSTEVSAALLHDLTTWGNLFDMKTNELASDAFHIIISLCISEDDKLKEFWESEIKPRLDNFLKAA